MHSNKLDSWIFRSHEPSHAIVLPDGCRDLIYRHSEGTCPFWMISPLFDSAVTIHWAQPTLFVGYRLKAGTSVNETCLMNELSDHHPDELMLTGLIDKHTTLTKTTEEILTALRRESVSVAQTAMDLGVTIRTLQRHTLKITHRTPAYWQGLARIRRCARHIHNPIDLCDLAVLSGYADQSHMSREFRRWLGVTPGQFRSRSDLRKTIAATGYGDD